MLYRVQPKTKLITLKIRVINRIVPDHLNVCNFTHVSFVSSLKYLCNFYGKRYRKIVFQKNLKNLLELKDVSANHCATQAPFQARPKPSQFCISI